MTTRERATVSVKVFKAPEGCQAHLVIDSSTHEALILDPRLDQVADLIEAAAAEGAKIRFVLDTHTHADHLSGVRALQDRTHATVLGHPAATTGADRVLEDGDVFELGRTSVRVIHSGGHTPDSLSLLIDGHLFTGDALFVGGAGRTDFPGGSTSDLYDTFRRFEILPAETLVHPGHDYVGRSTTTIGAEGRGNPLMGERNRDKLISRMDIKGPLPANMKSILAFNTKGPDPRSISPLELDAIRSLREGVQIVDVRGPSEFSSKHIAESRNIPFSEFEARIGEISGDGEVVLVCQSGVRSEEAARALERNGRRSRQLEGGILAWSRSGLPTSGRGHLPIERQVQLTVGSSVLIGSVLAAFVSPWFLLIPAFMGTGLTVAGATGTCGLALLLARLPWNGLPDGDASSACAVGGGSSCAAGGDNAAMGGRVA